VTFDPDFKVTTFYDIEYLRNDTRESHSYYRTSTEVVCALSNGDISKELDGPLTQFSRSRQFWSRISQKRCVSGQSY